MTDSIPSPPSVPVGNAIEYIKDKYGLEVEQELRILCSDEAGHIWATKFIEVTNGLVKMSDIESLEQYSRKKDEG